MLAERDSTYPDVVVFAPHSLTFLVRFDVGGDEWISGMDETSTNGTCSYVTRNATTVLATVDPAMDVFSLSSLDFDLDLGPHTGSIEFTIDTAVTDYPPVAASSSAALDSTVGCGGAGPVANVMLQGGSRCGQSMV